MINKTETPKFKGLSLVGGHPSMDLLNTVKYRGRIDPQDKFGCYIDVINWALMAGVVDKTETDILYDLAKDNQDAAKAVFHEICDFRENLRRIFAPEARTDEAVSVVEGAVEALQLNATIDAKTNKLHRKIPMRDIADLKHRIVHCTAMMMEMHPAPKIGTCAADDCDWLFIDNSKSKLRRWCDTKTCGNRARVRQFRTHSN